MKEAPILYFFAGNIAEIPSEYAGRMKTKGNGKLKLKNIETTGTFSSPYTDVLINATDSSHTWRQIHKKLYIGVSKSFNPETLQRETLHAGFNVDMGGHTWRVPILNPFSGNCSLPSCETVTWNEETGNKEVIQEVVEEYAELVAEISEFILDIDPDIKPESTALKLDIDPDKMRNIIARSIAVNYDISEDEILALGIFRTDTYEKIVRSIIDWDGIQRALMDRFSEGFFLNKENDIKNTSSGENN